MKVLLLSQYDESQATTRIRLISLQKKLRKYGFSSSLSYLVRWDFNKLPFLLKVLTLVYRYSHRFFILFFRKYDLIIFNREVFPKLPFIFDSIIFKSSKNVIMDLDDGIHLYYKNNFLKNKINKLVKCSNSLYTANINLYSHFSNFQKNIFLNYPFPDNIYTRKSINKEIIIGWIGSSSTTKYLLPILDQLRYLSKKYKFSLIIVGSNLQKNNLSFLKDIDHKIMPWNLKNEEYFFREISFGLMPLDLNSDFARFKSGYKLIQYLCHSIPSLSSKNEVTQDILGTDLFLCSDLKEWKSKLEWMFKAGYEIQEKWIKKNKENLISRFKKIPNNLIPS